MKAQCLTHNTLALRGLYPPQFLLCNIATSLRSSINIINFPLLRWALALCRKAYCVYFALICYVFQKQETASPRP